MSKPECLSLRPLSAAVQRVAVYETRSFLYVVGSTNDGTSCRLLKVSRTPPTGPSPSLEVSDVGQSYSEHEIKQSLIMLDDGNKCSANKFKSHGLKQVASAFGIVGFARFLEGFYIILITKRKAVATIGGHVLYKIEDTVIYPISNMASKPSNPDETKYLKIFQNVDLSSNFYFSYSYDLTLTLQCQMRTNPGPFPPPCRKFSWNDHLLQGFEGVVHSKWILHIVHGFVGQYNISVYGRPVYLTMIARRSKEFAGTRFLKRGANDEGHVANEVETEQLVHDASSSLHANGRYTSYIQLRGSVPSFWSQDLAGMRPKPMIRIDRSTPFASPAALHFMSCLKRFGSPVLCLNLVKKKERRKREAMLTDELLGSINYLNQFLPPEHHVRYIHRDMARINKSKTQNLIEILEKIADDCVKATGIFHSGPEIYCNKLHPHPDYKDLGGYGYRDDYVGKDQTGVLRVNCVDCLDRTNTAQFMAGKCALGYQLYVLGLLSEPKAPFDCETVRILEEAYEDLGDTLALQYGGSQLVHRIQTYRKVAPMANHGRDIYQTIHRYYRNAFTDVDKQMAINVFLGVFQPEEGEMNVWDLTTDYYLHHTQARVVPETPLHTTSYTKWWESELLSTLPLPLYRSERDPEGCNAASSSAREEKANLDSFSEVYKPLELTDFDALFSRNITRTAEDPNDASPFVVRAKSRKKFTSRKAWRQAIVGSPNPPQGLEEDSGGSSGGDSSEEDSNLTSQPSAPHQAHHLSTHSPLPELSDTVQAYGFELKDPSKNDLATFERYARVHRTACMPAANTGEPVELTSELVSHDLSQWEPTYDYGLDSVFRIEPPVVSEEDEKIYNQAVHVAHKGPLPLPQASLKLYRNYTKLGWT